MDLRLLHIYLHTYRKTTLLPVEELPFARGERLLLGRQKGSVAAALPRPATVINHAIGDKRVVA